LLQLDHFHPKSFPIHHSSIMLAFNTYVVSIVAASFNRQRTAGWTNFIIYIYMRSTYDKMQRRSLDWWIDLLTTHLHLFPISRICGVTSPSPHVPSWRDAVVHLTRFFFSVRASNLANLVWNMCTCDNKVGK
jgi:hypothetical protein